MVETLVEITGSVASGQLRGVIILEKGYSEDRQEVWVKVGISKKTSAVSKALEDLTKDGEASANPKSTECDQNSSVECSAAKRESNPLAQPSESIKRDQSDW
jgi:hypothetical protein